MKKSRLPSIDPLGLLGVLLLIALWFVLVPFASRSATPCFRSRRTSWSAASNGGNRSTSTRRSNPYRSTTAAATPISPNPAHTASRSDTARNAANSPTAPTDTTQSPTDSPAANRGLSGSGVDSSSRVQSSISRRPASVIR